MAKWDDRCVKLTSRYVDALMELMRAEIEMMKENEPQNKDCWTYGIATIEDLAYSNGISFEFGGDDDKPNTMKYDVQVKVL